MTTIQESSDLNVMASGSVLPPGAVSTKVDLGDTPMEVTITNVLHHEGDDCSFLVCKYPDRTLHHQVFLPLVAEDALHQMVNFFGYLYGRNVVPNAPLDVNNLVGQIITFTGV